MPPRLAVVLSIDRLGASWLGPYGNTWLETPNFNRLSAQSLLVETVMADAPTLPAACRAWWTGRHALAPDIPGAASLPALAATAGARAILITDESAVAEHPLAAEFAEVQAVAPSMALAEAQGVEETGLFGLFSAAVGVLEECRGPTLLWIHSRGMRGAWDAPYAWRERFADEDDPAPPRFFEPPSERLATGFDPDLLLGYTQAYAGQVALVDACLELLLAALDNHPLAAETIFAVTSPRGYPLGEHGRVGSQDEALYGELLHVPLWVRYPAQMHALMRSRTIAQPDELFHLLARGCGWREGEPTAGSLAAELSGTLAPLARAAYSLSTGQRSIRTPAWFLREFAGNDAAEREFELFAKPDDRFEANEVSSRCGDIVELLAAELARFEAVAQHPDSAQVAPLAAPLVQLWR